MLEANKYYTAIAIDAGLMEGKAGSVSAWMKFQIKDSDETITWYGQTKTEQNQQFTAEALINAGFRGQDLQDLTQPFDISFIPREVNLKTEEYKGKIKVKSVYSPKKEFKGQAPKMAAAFAKVKGTLNKTSNQDPF